MVTNGKWGGCKWPHCLTIGFLMFFGLLLNFQNNLFAEKFTVTFETGSSGPRQTVEKGGYATDPGVGYKKGYYFLGWYDGDNKFDFSTPITSSITLYAKWASSINTSAYEDANSNLKYYLYNIDGELVAQVVGMVDETATSITIPKEVTYNGVSYIIKEVGNIFCSETLTQVIFAEDSQIESIGRTGRTVFLNCDRLTTVVLPASLKSVKDSAFVGCCNLQLVVFSRQVIFSQKAFGHNNYIDFVNHPYKTVKYQDSDGTTVMTGLVFINNRTTAADPAKYGIIATWTSVLDENNNVVANFDFDKWTTPITENLIVKCSGPIYTVRYKDGNNTLTERYKFQQKSLKISFNGKPDISMPETISAKEAILLFLSNQKDPESNLFGMHFTITRTVEGNTQTGICQPKPWSKDAKDKLAQEKMLAKTDTTNSTFNYYIHSVTTDKANNSFTVYFIVDGNQLSFNSDTGILTAKDYQYKIEEDVVPINYHATMTRSAS